MASITFMAAATEALAKQYGERMSGPVEAMNRLIAALGEFAPGI